MNYVIIGNSAAAVGCIEAIRTLDQKGKITLITDEPYHTYSRPLISYWLQGKVDQRHMDYRQESFYKDHNVKCLFSQKAEKILPEEKTVLLESGETTEYDKLLCAAGSRPFVPETPGLETVPQAFTFMKYDDAKNIAQACTARSRILIVGAGLIGLKCAEGLKDRVQQVTVVDLSDRVLSSILDEEGSAIMAEHLKNQGLELRLSDCVEKYEKNTAFLKSGDKIEFDMLVTCVGVRPNTELVAQAGGKVNQGIVTDDRQLTSLPDVYAAGDCTESYDITAGQNRILALLPAAYMQGECAGIQMAGGDKRYNNALPMNAIGLFGLHIITAGSYDGKCMALHKEGRYKKLVMKGDCLVGYILIGDVDRAGIYTALIREKTPLHEIDREFMLRAPQLSMFGKSARQAKLSQTTELL